MSITASIMTNMTNMTFAKSVIDQAFLIQWNGKVNPADFTFSFLDGQFRATPELLEDLEAYYDISPDELLSFIRDTVTTAGIKDEVDLHISKLRAYRPRKESVWEFQVVNSKTKAVLARTYFSGLPIKPAVIGSDE